MSIFKMHISLIKITIFLYIMVNRDVCNIEISLNQMHLEVHVQKYVNKFRYFNRDRSVEKKYFSLILENYTYFLIQIDIFI